MNQSRTVKYDKRRLPREKRTIRIFGAASYGQDGRVIKDQSNKIFKCWNCGMICNETHPNIKVGDGVGYEIKEEISGIAEDLGNPETYPGSDGTMYVHLSLETEDTPHLMQLDSVGNPVSMDYGFTSIVTQGCPLCGCKQYR